MGIPGRRCALALIHRGNPILPKLQLGLEYRVYRVYRVSEDLQGFGPQSRGFNPKLRYFFCRVNSLSFEKSPNATATKLFITSNAEARI